MGHSHLHSLYIISEGVSGHSLLQLCTIFLLFFLATPGSICFPGGSNGKESACNADTRVQSQGLEDPLEKKLATHSSILDWRIPWTEKPGRLQSMGCQRVGHN